MKKKSTNIGASLISAALTLLALSAGGATAEQAKSDNVPVTDFTLLDQSGKSHSLHDYKDHKYVVIMAHINTCPIVRKSAARYSELKKEFGSDVMFMALNASDLDDRKSIAVEAGEYKLDVPVLLDPSQVVSRSLQMTRASEVVVIDTSNWTIRYKGPIDDRVTYGVDKLSAKNNYLADTLKRLIAGEKVDYRFVEAVGCAITYKKIENLSYSKHVVPIIQAKCLNCHSESASFQPKLDTYKNIAAWAGMIRETIFNDRMPPFSADTFVQEVKNDISLSALEKRTLIEWLDSGAPSSGLKSAAELTKKIPSLASPLKSNLKIVFEGKMEKPAEIDPKGPNAYRYFQLGEATKKDMWVRATNSISTNPTTLHHQILMIAPYPLSYYIEQTKAQRTSAPVSMVGDVPLIISNAVEQSQTELQNKRSFRIGTWFMGLPQPSSLMGDTVAYIPKGSYLILEVHHMGTGKIETEQTTLKLYGYFEKPKNKIFDKLTFLTTHIKIPANARVHYEYATLVADQDVYAYSFNAHMHMRGRAVEVSVETAAGKKTLVSIPRFDYGLLTAQVLEFKKPQFIPKGAKLVMRCEYDNSKFNSNNPDPNRVVSWGQTLSDAEMCLGILGVTVSKEAAGGT